MTKQITSNAFPEPNFTQTPNSFFEMIPSMEHSELAVTLVMIRNTFGYHRPSFKMGISKLIEATGMTRNSVRAGAESAETRGTFRRSNPDSQGEAEWELVVGSTIDPLNGSPLDNQPLTPESSTIDPQVGVKESIKQNSKENKSTSLLEKKSESSKTESPAKKKASRPAPVVERPPSATTLVMEAFKKHFKLTLVWGHPFDRPVLKWAMEDIKMTPEMLAHAANWWNEPEQLRWRPDGPGIFDIQRHWLKSIEGYQETSQQSQPARPKTRSDFIDDGGI